MDKVSLIIKDTMIIWMILIIPYVILPRKLLAKKFKIIGRVALILVMHGMEVVALKLKEICKFRRVS